jgi:hypothetical protein
VAKVVLSKIGAVEFQEALQVFTDEDKISLRYWITFVERNGILKAQENPFLETMNLVESGMATVLQALVFQLESFTEL